MARARARRRCPAGPSSASVSGVASTWAREARTCPACPATALALERKIRSPPPCASQATTVPSMRVPDRYENARGGALGADLAMCDDGSEKHGLAQTKQKNTAPKKPRTKTEKAPDSSTQASLPL